MARMVPSVRCTRILLLGATLLLLSVSAHAADAQSNAIAGLKHQTDHYAMSVFAAGHFAIKVGGSWMPGCICLSVNGTPQYKHDALSHMDCAATPLPDGRTITITGRLTPDVAFTETIAAHDAEVLLTYAVEALADMDRADISISMGPQLEFAKGLDFEVDAGGGLQQYTFPPDQPIVAHETKSITWRGLGAHDAVTSFEKGAAVEVRVSAESATYRVWLQNGAMKAGERAEAVVRFRAVPREGTVAGVRMVRGTLGHTSFTVGGSSGLLNNIRTDRGLLIEYLSINERDSHQVSAGTGKVPQWGGVEVASAEPGREYSLRCSGDTVNAWEESIEARAVRPGLDEIHLRARRTLDDGPQRLRVLMYVGEWLEQVRQPYLIRTRDGAEKTEQDGRMLWFGMPPTANETGLGRYIELGEYPTGTEVIVPMLSRGEVMTLRLGASMAISGFRFERYFRGMWLQAPEPDTAEIDLTVSVERLPPTTIGRLDVYEHGDAVSLTTGGTPLLERIKANGAEAAWEWRADGEAAVGRVRTAGESITMDIPRYLHGRTVTIHPAGGEPYSEVDRTPLRLGAELPPLALAAGSRIEFAPTALERMSISLGASAQMKLNCSAQGHGTLTLRGDAGIECSISHAPIAQPEPDRIACRPVPDGWSEPYPGPFSGLEVLRDAPDAGDITVRSLWWEVVHSRAHGGAISSITFSNGTGQNILRAPISSRIVAGATFTDVLAAEPVMEVEQADPGLVRLFIGGSMTSADGEVLGPFEHIYEYRPMLVRRTCSYGLGVNGVDCTGVSVGAMALAPWLDEAAVRRADDRTEWYNAVFPGPRTFEETTFSEYMCLCRRGVEGIDWVPACDLTQWRGFGTGQDGDARYAIEDGGDGCARMAIEPLAIGSDPVRLTGTITFESYLSLPQVKRCLRRQNFVACLDPGECTENMLDFCAEYGVTDIMLGAGITPGTFQVASPAACKQAIDRAHARGMKVYPFDPFQLVNRRAGLWEQHEQQGRYELKDGKPELEVYSSYGDYFCPTAEGFRAALKAGYRSLVESVGFDGLYHDFAHPYHCHNTAHHPTPHMNTDGVLDVILWDREFLGPDRVFCGHTGWVPVLFFQDLCTVSAIFEEYPSSSPLPLYLTPAQGEFVNAAQMTLVSSFLNNGASAPADREGTPAPGDLVDAYLARCALVGVFPWMHAGNMGAADVFDLPEKARPWLKLFALRGDEDLATMQFLPYYRQTAVLCGNSHVRAATYWRDDHAIIILANSETSDPQEFMITILPAQLGWPGDTRIDPQPGKDCTPLSSQARANTFTGSLDGFGFAMYHIHR